MAWSKRFLNSACGISINDVTITGFFVTVLKILFVVSALTAFFYSLYAYSKFLSSQYAYEWRTPRQFLAFASYLFAFLAFGVQSIDNRIVLAIMALVCAIWLLWLNYKSLGFVHGVGASVLCLLVSLFICILALPLLLAALSDSKCRRCGYQNCRCVVLVQRVDED